MEAWAGLGRACSALAHRRRRGTLRSPPAGLAGGAWPTWCGTSWVPSRCRRHVESVLTALCGPCGRVPQPCPPPTKSKSPLLPEPPCPTLTRWGGIRQGHLKLGHDLRPQKAWGSDALWARQCASGQASWRRSEPRSAGHSYSDDSCTHSHTHWVFALIQTSQPRPRNGAGNNWQHSLGTY